MDIHKNARLTPLGRERLVKMVLGGQTPQAASEAGGVCLRTVRKWVGRYEQEGLAGLQDRNSRPHRLYQPTPQVVIDRIESLRRQRRPGKEIAAEAGVSPATVSRVLKKLGLNKLSALEPAAPARRYERDRPGEMIHIDIKKLGKFDQIGHRITGDRKGQSNSRGVGWSSSMSASTTPRVWPSARSSRTSESEVPWPSSRPLSPTTQAWALPSSAS